MRPTKKLKAPFVITLSIGLVLMSPAAAGAADPDPVGDLVNGITKVLEPAPPSTAVEAPQPPADDSDSPGNETVDPVAPDHGATKGVEANLAGNPVAGITQDNATVNDDDSTSADSTLLSLGGTEVIGAHADSEGNTTDEFDPLGPVTGPVCDGSAGAVCLDVLYSRAEATDDGTTSTSKSESGIARACVGGTVPTADPCTGPVRVGVANSEANAQRDQESGRTTADSSYTTEDVCVQPDPITGICGVGVAALDSRGDADSGAGSIPASANRSSFLADLALGGMNLGTVSDPMDLSLPPGCPSPSVLCVFVNQGETYLGSGVAGHAQDALKVTALRGSPLELFVGVGRTETLVHNDGGEEPPVDPPVDPPDGPDGPDGPDDSSVLPDTGGPRAGLLGIALLGIAVGSFFVAAGRRQSGAVV